ncbi:conserved Plasmodium protein, unknown function [Plasmodium ovale wallikeri]|uniref:Uncharacterized protein n=1 Tax=Plasmodium ovale wallikeri TaxID=864142 RepID=A0A1A9A310_PLAOA|nr:conserved Plasmodium protein, unknown function [Plasmodium ovale wallikeri]SBT50895.1 conserved Plasmodium protein, unknown function [Plasmodium ovale wallikeri]
MNISDDLQRLLRKLKKKKKNLANKKKKKNSIFDMIEEWDDYCLDDLCTVQDVFSDINWVKEEELDKYKNVYNNFESEINYYFSEYVEGVIYSSVVGQEEKRFGEAGKMGRETFSLAANPIYHHLYYGSLLGKKLRSHECATSITRLRVCVCMCERAEWTKCNMKTFELISFSDSSSTSDERQISRERGLRDITKREKRHNCGEMPKFE